MRLRHPSLRRVVQLAATSLAVASVAANVTTTPQRDDPFHQAGFQRQVVHAQPETEGDFSNFEHVANIDLSVFQAMALDDNDQPFRADSGMGTFLDFTSFEVDGEGLRDFALLGTDFDGQFVIDITDPAAPYIRGHIPCRYEQSEVRIVAGLDRPVIAIANQGGPSCVPEDVEVTRFELEDGPVGLGGRQGAELISVWDISDPDEPAFLSAYADNITAGTHTMTAHPTEPVVIPVGGSQERLVFVDLSDPTTPAVRSWIDTPGMTHAAHFSPDGTQLGTAGGLVEAVAVFDTSDLDNPVIEAVAAVPGQTYSHEVHPFSQVDPVTGIERRFHVASEENLGGPFAGYCSGTGFFIFEQVGPVMTPMSFTTAGFAPGTSSKRNGQNEYCTAHYGSISHDGMAYVIPWYIAGLYVFDLELVNLPTEVGHAIFPDSNIWSAKAYKDNHVFAGDLSRGFDVYRYTGELDLAQVAPAVD